MNSLRLSGRVVRVLAALVMVAIGVVAPTAAFAQTSGSITGTAVDISGGAIVGAAVTVLDATGAVRGRATTDASGVFAVSNIAPGRYTVQIESRQFDTTRVDVEVVAGSTPAPVRAILKVSAVRESVNVTAPTAYVRPEATTATKTDAPIRDVPQSIEVRTRQLLDDLGGRQTSYDVGRTVAGVFDNSNGQGDPGRNVPNFTIRGFGGLYLRDGHPVNGWMSTTDMANVERVEFLKGPASMLYGGTGYAGDIGGAVNYVSKVPQATRVAGLDMTGGAYNFFRTAADFGQAANKTGTVSFRVNGALESGSSFRDFAKHDTQYVAPALSLQLAPSDTVTILAEGIRSHEVPERGLPMTAESFGISRSKNFIDAGFSKTDIRAEDVTIKYNHAFAGSWRFEADLFRSRSRTESFGSDLSFDTSGGGGSTLVASHWNFAEDQTNLDLRGNGTIKMGPLTHTILLGYNLNRNAYVANSEYNFGSEPSLPLTGSSLDQIVLPPSGDLSAFAATAPTSPFSFTWNSNTNAFYVQDLVSVAPGVKLLLAARHDRFKELVAADGSLGPFSDETPYTHTSPRVGLVLQPGRATSIYAVQAEAFTPNTGLTLDNTPPEPERGLLREVGLKQTFGPRVALDLAYYDLTRRNMTFADPADPAGVAVLVAGETRSRGFEIDLNGQVTDALRVNVAATAMKGWISEGEPNGSLVVGQEFAGTPRGMFNLFGIQSFGPDRKWEAGAGVYYASQAWADQGNTFEVPAVFQLDAVAGYRFAKQGRLQINIRNLTGRSNYVSYYGAWIIPGEPRSVSANVKLAF